MQKYAKLLVCATGSVMTVIGCWPPHYYGLPNPWKFVYRALTWLMYSCMAFVILMAAYNLHETLENFLAFLNFLFIFLGLLLAFVKQSILIFYRKKLLRLFNEIESVRNSIAVDLSIEEVKNLDDLATKKSNYTSKLALRCILTILALYNVNIMVQFIYSKPDTYIMPYLSKFPFKYETRQIYFLLLLVQMCGSLISACVFTSVDALFMNLAIFVVTQFRILGVCISKCDDYNVEDDSNYLLKKCARYHQKIFQFCDLFQEFYSPILFTQIVISAIMISTSAIETLTTNDITIMVKSVSSMLLIIACLFTYCWNGEQITNESFLISTKLYNTKWYEKNFKFKTTLLIMNSKSQRYLYISGMGFMNASYESFSSILQTAYSYFTVMYTLKDKN